MQRRWKMVVLTAAVLGWLLDFLFWKQAPGINFALYSFLCLVGGLVSMRLDGRAIGPGSRWLLALIALFAAFTFIRAEPLTLFLCAVATLFLMAVLAVTFVGGRWVSYGVVDYAVKLARLAWSMITRPLAFFAQIRAQPGSESGNPFRTAVWPVVRGVLIALPIVVLFAALLASADVVFGQELQALLQSLQLERLPEYVFRLIYMLLAGYALIGVFLHAGSETADERLSAQSGPMVPQFLGLIEAAIVLGSVSALFGAFVMVQFQYFFGGRLNINVEGYTYADYARRGFGELMVVAVFSLVLLLCMITITRRHSGAQQRTFSALGVLVVALVGVILLSAFQRLGLYELAYGFSRLRTYAHVLLVWIGLLLAAVAVLELLSRERLFLTATLAAALGFVFSLALLNVDGFIVRQNVLRVVRGEALDVPYLVSLSSDADPILEEIFSSFSDPAVLREEVGAVLTCRAQLNLRHSSTNWRSFTMSRLRSERAFREIQRDLVSYRLLDSEQALRVVTPGGAEFECLGPAD